MRSLRMITAVTAVALVAGGVLVPASGAAAKSPKLCGWSGNVVPLMEKADRQVRSPRVTERVQELFGSSAVITSYMRMEVDLETRDPSSTKPTDAATLTVNKVSYNLQVAYNGTESGISAQVRFDGLCFRTTVVVNDVWVGSTGTDKPLKVNANKTLKLAQAYREKHPADFPLEQPLVMMNLLQATTAPPDFGKLRWYVNYDNGAGGLSIIAVYMNKKVVAIT